MAISYTQDKKFSILGEVLNEYQSWFSAVVQHVCYDGEQLKAPEVFSNWLETISFEKIDIEGRYAEEKDRLLAQHKALTEEVSSLTNASDSKNFADFSEKFKELIAGLHSFCQAVVLEQDGLDIMTGLKNNAVIERDLAIEMERLAREGYPFCLGLARIDDFETIKDHLEREAADTIVKTVADFVLRSLRSYDDAYRVNRDHFIMCLKQSDMIGGQKALERLRDILEGADEGYVVNEEKKPLSVSCCVAAPLPGDDLDDLIDNLYVDLDQQIKDPGSVLTYQELSPLQRLMKEEKEEGA